MVYGLDAKPIVVTHSIIEVERSESESSGHG